MNPPRLPAHLNYSDDGRLSVDSVPLEQLCRQFGSPLFVGSQRQIEDNVARFLRAFSGYPAEVLLSYSTKTNSNLGVLQTLQRTPALAGVCSELDYRAARLAGFPAERMIVDGLVKNPRLLLQAVRERVALVNAESWEELVQLEDAGRQENCVIPVGLRIRMGPPKRLFPSVKSLLGISYDRFGFDLRSGWAAQIVDRVRELTHVRLEGLLVHEGSHYRCSSPYRQSFRALIPLIRKIARTAPSGLRTLNLGGGFGVDGVKPYSALDLIRNGALRLLGRAVQYDLSGQRLPLERMASEIVQEVTSFFRQEGLPLPRLVFEPGRFIAGDAFVLVSQVLLRKQVPRSGTWLILDAGTNLFPYLLSFNEYHLIVPVQRPLSDLREIVHLAGPLLYSSDLVMKNGLLPRLESGARVALLDAGAYTLAYSNQFLYPRPAVVLVDSNGQPRLIRQAETHEDVLAKDLAALKDS